MNLGIGLGVTNYLRVPTVALDPDAAIAELFRTGTPGVYYEGAWYDPSDSSTVWQDAAGTTPAGVGDPVGRIDDKSGNGNHATQTTSAARPVLQQSGDLYYLDFDGVDDWLNTPNAALDHDPFTALFASQTSVLNGRVLDNRGAGLVGTLAGWQAKASNDFDVASVDDGAVNFRASQNYQSTATTVHAVFWNQTSFSHNTNRSALSLNGSVPTGSILTGNAGRIGAAVNDGSQRLNGNLYGVIVIDRVLNATEIAAAEDYLATKSGVTL